MKIRQTGRQRALASISQPHTIESDQRLAVTESAGRYGPLLCQSAYSEEIISPNKAE